MLVLQDTILKISLANISRDIFPRGFFPLERIQGSFFKAINSSVQGFLFSFMSQMHLMPLYAQSKPSNILPCENIIYIKSRFLLFFSEKTQTSENQMG